MCAGADGNLGCDAGLLALIQRVVDGLLRDYARPPVIARVAGLTDELGFREILSSRDMVNVSRSSVWCPHRSG
jgi:hypothetical protein